MFTFSFFKNTSYTFEGKKEGEEVILFMHRHWYTLVSKLTYIVIGGFLPFIALVVLGQILINYNLIAAFAFLWACYYLFLWFSLFYILTMYTLDTWTVTNFRIIDSRQHGFFNRTVSELSLGNIQDVSFNVEGALPTMMNYGDVSIQTAGRENHFQFQQIQNPQQVKDEIVRITSEFKTKNNERPLL